MTKRTPRAPRPPHPSGFTLVELVIATTIGAMLLVAVAEVAQLFGKEVEVVRDESDWRLQESLVRMTDEVKRAWIVGRPSADVLELTDAFGNVTRYEHDAVAETLVVRRPSGAVGTVLTGVEAFTVDPRTVTRYREDTSLDAYATWWEDGTTLGATAEAIPVEDGLPLALGFTLDTTAPDWVHTVEGVEEQNELATLERVVLPLAFVTPVSEWTTSPSATSGDTSDPGTTDSGTTDSGTSDVGSGTSDSGDATDSTGGGKGGGAGGKGGGAGSGGPGKGGGWDGGGGGKDGGGGGKDGGGGKGGGGKGGGTSDKLDLCHVPPGNATNATTLSIPIDAVQGHLDHGDYTGVCSTTSVTPDPADTVVFIDLYEAAAPDDARPYGALLGTTSLPATALPTGSYSWVEKAASTPVTHGGGEGGAGVAVCHLPPADPANMHTMHLAPGIVDEHLSHGDVIGSCETSLDEDTTWVLEYDVPGTDVPVDLVALNGLIEPGRAHTLVFRVSGSGTLLLAGQPVGTETNSGVAAVHVPGGDYARLDLGVPRSLDGMRTCSQTEAVDVISGVTLTLETADGERLSASAAVASQVAVDNPWLGCVPGEYPGLELAGQ